MSFPNIKITDAGRLLMAQVLAGEQVEFTHFAIGSGRCGNADDWKGLTEPIVHVMDADITKFTQTDEKVVLNGEFSNANVPGEFWWSELGIFATLPNVADYGNVMCFYGNAEDLAEFVPGPNSEIAVTHRWDTTLALSSTCNVSALVQSITYATLEQFNKHAGNKDNPHGVTKEQIGLSNVLNVAPDNMIIHRPFDLKDLQPLVEGEPLNVTIMKLGGAIHVLDFHLKNKSNPHGVTAEQAGAAEKNHQSADAVYGLANSKFFGHVKLTDEYAGAEAAGNGIAVTPKALKDVYDSLASDHGSYVGTGLAYTGSNVQQYGTAIFIRNGGAPKFLYIQGTNSAQKHIAFIQIDGSNISGISIIDGVATPLMGKVVNAASNGIPGSIYYICTADTNVSTAERQMNLLNETYNYTVMF